MKGLFPRLPVLDAVATHLQPDLRGLCIVAVQHLLETTGSLFESFVNAGCRPERIHVIGKLYSTNPDVALRLRQLGLHIYRNGTLFRWGHYDEQLTADCAAMWAGVERALADDVGIERVIVLDEGGFAASTVPPSVAARFSPVIVEQTSSGLTNHASVGEVPVVAVASSAVKRRIEPRIIQAAAFKRAFGSHRGDGPLAMGIIGLGAIGRAISEALATAGHSVLGFDPSDDEETNLSPAIRTSSLDELWRRASVLWGCSGADAFQSLDESDRPHDRELVSCSSSDREFRSLLRPLNGDERYRSMDRLSDIRIVKGGKQMVIRRGGFPINFDGSNESAPAADIQLTRGLLFLGVVQALKVAEVAGTIVLAPAMQRFVLSEWLKHNPERARWYADELLDRFNDDDWIRDQSLRVPACPPVRPAITAPAQSEVRL